MKETLYVIIKKNNAYKRIKKNKDVFTLNQYILSEQEKTYINNIYPDAEKTSIESKECILKTHKLKKDILNNISKIHIFKNTKDLDELLDPLLEIKISRYLYLKSVIPKYKKYILIDNKKIYKLSSKLNLIIKIDEIYCDSKNKNNDFLKKFYRYDFNIYNNILLKLQSKLLKNILKTNKKEIFFFSDQKAYFIETIKEKLSDKKNIFIYYSPTGSYLRIISILFEQFYFMIFKKNLKEIGIFLLSSNKIDKNNSKIYKDFYKFRIPDLEKEYSSYLAKQLYFYLLNTISFQKYLSTIFRGGEISKSFFHSVRFPDLFSFSRILKKSSKDLYLISHGSNTIQKEDISGLIASKSLGIGLSYTKEKKIKLLSQSIFCDDFLNSINLKYLKINRLIKFNKNNIDLSDSKKNEFKTKILFIGTVKQLGERRYYFESSQEFFESINRIYNGLIKYKELFEINLRIRDVNNEINNEILKNALFKKNDLIKIDNSKTIYEEMINSDCIISFSSTTLEEALTLNKPVMCFGLPTYNHLRHYENDENKIKNHKKGKNLEILEMQLGRKFIFNSQVKREINLSF